MISEAELAHWRSVVPWVERSQVEQDLVLSRLIIEIARHPLLGSELVFRGGTCFHKLWLDRSWRYSEDLDYVRRSATGVGEVFDALREVQKASASTTSQRKSGGIPRSDCDPRSSTVVGCRSRSR